MSTVVARGTARRLGIDRPQELARTGGVEPLRQALLRMGMFFKPPIVEAPEVEASDAGRSRRCAHCEYWEIAAWRYGALGPTQHVCVRDSGAELIVWAQA